MRNHNAGTEGPFLISWMRSGERETGDGRRVHGLPLLQGSSSGWSEDAAVGRPMLDEGLRAGRSGPSLLQASSTTEDAVVCRRMVNERRESRV